MGIRILSDKCTGCKLCLGTCPFGVIYMEEKLAVIEEGCTLCGACVKVCKFDAIELERATEPVVDFDAYKGVLIVAEQKQGELQSVTYELLGEGRKLADARKSGLYAVLIGSGISGKADDLIARGADKVFIADQPYYAEYQDEPYARVLCRVINDNKPEIVICGATAIGRSLIPRVAVQIRTGLTADCTALAIGEGGELLQTRPAFGGNIMATILTPRHRPQMATVRHKVLKEAAVDKSRTGEIITIESKDGDDNARAKVVDFVEEIESTVNLAEADIIVSGGRGMGGPENFNLIEELALEIGGAVGASRAVVDAGWIPYSHQVGQTGKTVQPKLYIACGISGAIQHLAGMQSSDVIVAINKNADSPIFEIATYGIVGDVMEVLPIMTKKLKERRMAPSAG